MSRQSSIGVEMETLERWLSVEEIGDYLGVSKETVYRWLDKAAIPAHRIGKLWKFKPSEVDDWVRSGQSAELNSPKRETEVNG